MKMQIQSSIMGFSRTPTSVYSIYDDEANYLVVIAEKEWRTTRFKECVLISDEELDDRDFLFNQQKVSDAINAYYDMVSLSSIEVKDSVARCNPDAGIEYDGLKEGGKIFRLSPDITNSQVAVLAACLFIKDNKKAKLSLDMADDLRDLMQGDVITI